VITDFVKLPALACPQKNLVDGDARCATVAAASIVAKVTRDRLMLEADKQFPSTASRATRATAPPIISPRSIGWARARSTGDILWRVAAGGAVRAGGGRLGLSRRARAGALCAEARFRWQPSLWALAAWRQRLENAAPAFRNGAARAHRPLAPKKSPSRHDRAY